MKERPGNKLEEIGESERSKRGEREERRGREGRKGNGGKRARERKETRERGKREGTGERQKRGGTERGERRGNRERGVRERGEEGKDGDREGRKEGKGPKAGGKRGEKSCSLVSHFPYTYAHLSVCRNYKRQRTTRQSPITETKRRVPLSPSNFLPSSVPLSRIFHTHTHICLCVEITKTKYNKTESNHRDKEEGSPPPKQFSSVQCSLVSHFPYTCAHLPVFHQLPCSVQQSTCHA